MEGRKTGGEKRKERIERYSNRKIKTNTVYRVLNATFKNCDFPNE